MTPSLQQPLSNEQYIKVLKALDAYDAEKDNAPELMGTLGKYLWYTAIDFSIVKTMTDLPWLDYDGNIIPLASQWWTLVNDEYAMDEKSRVKTYLDTLLNSNFGRATALMYAWILDEHPSRKNIKHQLQVWSQFDLPKVDEFKHIYQESHLAWILHQWGQPLEQALEARSWLTMLKTLNANTRQTSQLKQLYDPSSIAPSLSLPSLPEFFNDEGP